MNRTAALPRGVKATWLYTYSSVIFVIAVAMFMVVLYAFVAQDHAWIQTTVTIASVIHGLALCWLTLRFKDGLWQGYPNSKEQRDAQSTVASGLVWASAVIIFVATLWTPQMVLMGSVPLQMALWTWMMFDPTKTWRPWVIAVVVSTALHALLNSWINQTASIGKLQEPFMVIFTMFFYPATLVLGLWFWDVMRQLEKARRTEGELAVTRERLRFASDLHDIQGHHLQVIALKTELAERTMEKNPQLALSNLREAREQAKLAMEETRALVHGYREVTLEQELRNAAQVLSAAGVECAVSVPDFQYDDAASVPESTHRLLGHVVREGTTNILRHSSATQARITLEVSGGVVRLEIRNNNAAEAQPPTEFGQKSGSGIAGLRERVLAARGELTAQREGDDFVLGVAMPQEVLA
jgi:two-component system sensor histidine kinase DesK